MERYQRAGCTGGIHLSRAAGFSDPGPSELPGLRLHRCDGHLLAINSTELRERSRQGLSLDYFARTRRLFTFGETTFIASDMKKTKTASRELLKICCHALDEKKAGDLRVFDVSEQSSITDFLILATATSDPHLRALRVELEKVVDASKTRIVGIDAGARAAGWSSISSTSWCISFCRTSARIMH